MTQYRVVIPEESGKIVDFQMDGFPAVAAVNSALKGFEPKVVFGWHVSLTLRFVELVANGMPSIEERAVTNPFCDTLDAAFNGEDENRPNALFLARTTWNGTHELLYRVVDPKPIDAFLKALIASKSHPREFDYRIEHDPEWKLAEWYLSAGGKKG